MRLVPNGKIISV